MVNWVHGRDGAKRRPVPGRARSLWERQGKFSRSKPFFARAALHPCHPHPQPIKTTYMPKYEKWGSINMAEIKNRIASSLNLSVKRSSLLPSYVPMHVTREYRLCYTHYKPARRSKKGVSYIDFMSMLRRQQLFEFESQFSYIGRRFRIISAPAKEELTNTRVVVPDPEGIEELLEDGKYNYVSSSVPVQLQDLPSKDVSFSEWSALWLETYKRGRVRPNTYHVTYRNIVFNHLNRHFEDTPVRDITPLDIQNALMTEAQIYSDSTMRKVKAVYAIFDRAVDNGICQSNPVRNIPTPPGLPCRPKRVYSKREAQTLIDFAKTHPKGASIITLLKTGMRRGELVALMWKDIDFRGGIIHISRAAADVHDKVLIGPPKTKTSVRAIPFDSELKRILASLPQTSPFVFPNRYGEINSPNNWSRRTYRPFMEAFARRHPNVPILNPHELRHTYGTLLRDRGVDIYSIQKVLGHADISMTSQIYVHNNEKTLKKALGLK